MIVKQLKDGRDGEDKRGKEQARKVRDQDFIETVRAEVEADRRVTITKLVERCQASRRTINLVLTEDLGLSKKSARWVPKILSTEQKSARAAASKGFLKPYRTKGEQFLDNIVTMDETAVSYFTPETKNQSKQWVQRGQPGPIKGKVQASRIKQMVLAFFDNQGLIYSNIVPRGTGVNAQYIVGTLKQFFAHMRQKRPAMAQEGFIFHWDNAPVHTAAIVADFLAGKNVQMLEHPPYSPDLAPADFWFFPKVKAALAGKTLSAETFKKEWEGVTRPIAAEEYAAAFQKWADRHNKSDRLAGEYVEKSQ